MLNGWNNAKGEEGVNSPVKSLSELVEAGLLQGMEPAHLTPKGREWLRQLEEVETREVAEDQSADFVLSINALSR